MKRSLIEKTARMLKEYYPEHSQSNKSYQDSILYELDEGASDYDLVVIAKDIVTMAADRLDADLNDTAIKEEYDKLKKIANELDTVIKNYV